MDSHNQFFTLLNFFGGNEIWLYTARLSPGRSLHARPLLGFQDDAARGLEILQVLGVFRLGLDPGLGETSNQQGSLAATAHNPSYPVS